MKITSLLFFLATSAVIASPVDTNDDSDTGLDNEAPNELFARKDGYPYASRCNGKTDKWDFYRCQCTSYVAWRLNQADRDLDFDNHYKGVRWSDAENWDNAARKAKVKINKKPKVGAVAQTDKGPGHVAYVIRVSKDKKRVDVEEYNFVYPDRYSKRTGLDASQFNYIHFS